MTNATTLPTAARHLPVSVTAISAASVIVARIALAATLGLIGFSKFTAAEAAGIMPLIAHSPLLSWLYSIGSVQAVSNIIGTSELVTVGLILLRPVSARAAAVGGLLAVLTFLTTLTFLLSTPGAFAFHGLAVLSDTGAFLIKDLGLLTASLVVLGEALTATHRQAH